LIGVNALYVAAEFGAVTARRSRIRQLAEGGHALASRLLPVLEDGRRLDQYIAACQIGITWSSLVLGAYGQAALAVQLTPLFERWAALPSLAAGATSAVVVLVALTALQVVLGELVPKSLALQYPTQVALYTFLPMRWSLTLYSWFTAALNGSGWAILRLLGMPQAAHRHIHTPEEIDLLIAESRDGGLLEPDEQRRLHSALRLGMRPVRQLMVPRLHLETIDVDASPDEVCRKVADSPYTRLLVYRGSPDNIIGMLHTKDLVKHCVEQRGIGSVEGVMRPILSVPESMRADRLQTLWRQHRSHQAIVVDEFGVVAGLVTLEDVLSELLGEVADEFKAGPPQPERLPDGRVRLPGLTHLDEAEAWLGARWHGEADTVAGHVIRSLGRLPRTGERVTINGMEVEIERVMHRTVASILVTPITPAERNDRE
jgi:CBS domain containing-hemolysin-like protein